MAVVLASFVVGFILAASATTLLNVFDAATVGKANEVALVVDVVARDVDSVTQRLPVAQRLPADYSVRFRGGLLYLTGTLPTKESANRIVERAAAEVGLRTLVVEHQINPNVAAPRGVDIPVVVEDRVYFDSGQSTVPERYFPLLKIGANTLSEKPEAWVVVRTYAGAGDDPEANPDLAQRRAESVLERFVAFGGDPAQMILDPQPTVATPVEFVSIAAEQPGRAEFTVHNILVDLFE